MGMKRFIGILLCLLGSVTVTNAQDIITKKNGDEIKAKVLEIGVKEVKYKRFGNESGPTYTLSKSEIFLIKYENGDKDVFNEKTKEKDTPVKEAVPEKKQAIKQTIVKSEKTEQVRTVEKAVPAEKTVPVVKPLSTEEFRNKFLSLGLSIHIIDDTFVGGALGFGCYLSPKSLLSIEYSGGSFTGEKIGSFSYYITKNGSTTNYYDGKITYDYSINTFLLSWSYVAPLSEKVQWRIGPSIGIISITGKDAYNPTYTQGTKIDGLPKPESTSEIAAYLGANTGLTWNFSERWFADLGFRLSANTGLEFEKRYLSNGFSIPKKEFSTIGSQLNIIVGWRF
jgi:hypothetical protein